MGTVDFNDFTKLDIRIGKIKEATSIEGSAKLLKLKIEVGKEERTLVAGLADYYDSDVLQDKEVPVLLNLEPREIMGVESQGMILAADVEGEPVLIAPERIIPTGSKVR